MRRYCPANSKGLRTDLSRGALGPRLGTAKEQEYDICLKVRKKNEQGPRRYADYKIEDVP